MATKQDLDRWFVEARKAANDGSWVEVCKYVWEHHADELKRSGDLFYTRQYDIRWAAQRVRRQVGSTVRRRKSTKRGR
jgi:hypothetical protein